MSALIELELTHHTGSGPRYRVLHDGAELLPSSRNPECDAARELSKRGVTGRIQWKRRDRDRIDGSGLIAILATRTITEGAKLAPRWAKWSPYTNSAE